MILVACGLIREVKLLSRPGLVVIAGGGDAVRLEAALEERAGEAQAVLSCGIGGALDPALKAGDVVFDLPHPREGGSALQKGLRDAHPGRIVGQDHICATAAGKAALRARTGASAVDMESHVAARVAARHGLPFAAIRTISDRADETLPPAALVGMNPDGSMALGRVLASLARHPVQLPALIRTGTSAEAAFRALGRVGDALGGLGVGGLDLGQLPLDMA